MQQAPRASIEFWFDFGSNYSYISAMRIEQAAAVAGRQVLWRSFLLGPIFRSFGWETSPFVLQKEKGAYTWRDMERECARFGLSWKKPTVFPRAAVMAHRLVLLARDQPWVGEFCRQVMARNFVEDADIAEETAMVQVLKNIGQHPTHWIGLAKTDAAKAMLRESTEEARRRGIFGAPTFFVDDEMFWGNDRLEQALAWRACAPELGAPLGADTGLRPSGASHLPDGVRLGESR